MGHLIGNRYDIVEEIGRGGMGNVYKVYDPVKDTYFALKELSRNHIDSPVALLRFKNEFRIMTEFRHPNIVNVFEFGTNPENIPYIVMEFISGKDLSECLHLSVEQVIGVLVQVCQALAVIHSRFYVHRDLKLDNIKHLDDGSIKLLDYGLISQLGVPASGKISGTFHYLAPEVIVGGIIDESTDLYSLGVIGYELLTRQLPFTGNKREILQGHLKQRPVEPIDIRPGIPSSVNSMIMKLLEKNQERRYRNCSEVLEDLRYLTGKTYSIDTPGFKEGYLYSNTLIGRSQEIERFRERLRQLQNGQSNSLFIGAPAGMGKTRLLNEMKILAELEGIRSVYLDSRNTGDEIYGWVHALIRHLTLKSGDHENLLAAYSVSEGSPLREDEFTERMIRHMTSDTETIPLILFFDDVQWMDVKSIQVLNKVIRRQEQCRLLCVFGFRSDELDKTSPLWHTVEEELSEYLELVPLNAQQTRRLLDNLLAPFSVSEEFSTYCFRNCGGNVFDLIEFLRYFIAEGLLTKSGDRWLEPVNIGDVSMPSTLEDRLFKRMNTLLPDARALAQAASIIGDHLDLESWQVVSGAEENRFFSAIDELMRYQIIIKTPDRYQFAHDKIRTAFYESLEPQQKNSYHEKTARFLESKTADRQELLPAIAKHFVESQQADKAIQYSLQAAKSAEQNNAEWNAFDHYRNAVRFLEMTPAHPNQEGLLLEIYEKAAQFSSAAWIDASTCLKWLQKTIDVSAEKGDIEHVFGLSLSYVVNSSISGNYDVARRKIDEILTTCDIQGGTLSWAILYGAGVCLTDWYQGHQQACFEHAVTAISIFEEQLDTLSSEAWPSYSWALFWREKARAYLGQPINMTNVEKIHQLMVEGKSDQTIYWHTLTAVTARAAFTGRWDDLLEWKQRASHLSREMGKIYWFECWISHSYLYGAIHHGEFSQLDDHIEKVQVSPDPYQVRLASLFRGMLRLSQKKYQEAEESLLQFLHQEEKTPDNSYLEGYIYLAQTYLATERLDEAKQSIEQGLQFATQGLHANPLYHLQFLRLEAVSAMLEVHYGLAEEKLRDSLQLAEKLENPLQQGFIQTVWGRLYLMKGHIKNAVQRLERARMLFLSINNKYQAGQVVSLLESLAQSERHQPLSRNIALTPPTSLEEDAITQLDGEPPKPSISATNDTWYDAHTELENEHLEETRDETIDTDRKG